MIRNHNRNPDADGIAYAHKYSTQRDKQIVWRTDMFYRLFENLSNKNKFDLCNELLIETL